MLHAGLSEFLLWEFVKDESVPDKDKKATMLDFDKVLGLGLATYKYEPTVIPKEILGLVKEREKARESKD